MKNTISFLIAVSIVVISINSAFAFGDAANSPNANANVYNTFQSEREGLRVNASQISRDAGNARAYMVEKTSNVKSAVTRTAAAANSLVENVTNGELHENINDRIETGAAEIKTGYQNFKNKIGPAVKESVSRFKQGVANSMENTTTNVKHKLHPIGYSVRSVVDKAGSAVGHAIDNVLSR